MLQKNKINIYNKPRKIKKSVKDLKLWIEDILLLNNLTGFVVNFIFVDEEEIRYMNKKYRRIDKPTDVISFSLIEGKFVKYSYNMLGDVYICTEQIRPKNDKEILRRMVHGVLHLIGYDHKREKEFKKFLKLENRYLSLII
ncbi:MAG: rRNA maturation RNase YbeY [bacterium]|uniref:Endoribonuclease YbeY n=2 Tax=Bacteria candidate phyla TaxID=1783234 RepID=A0A101I0A0_UNCT6|nr:MAG: Endoribonuclease YbeY [candidate division TA06 bacterium 32_111]KUK86258.1 MAG: Endoribonuclease YbeY [candidate division TA06 bacterium 34_109]MDI6699948.1 rRNA maturation RNase YbeY [bacterium]HAF08338.1 rRNA maturation RNase YbeY [candidate division WOR-3 bacterium]HCP17024.1 rRNA maturation RNase YbeY [candidate division WOR-3 bacterium]